MELRSESGSCNSCTKSHTLEELRHVNRDNKEDKGSYLVEHNGSEQTPVVSRYTKGNSDEDGVEGKTKEKHVELSVVPEFGFSNGLL